MKSDKEIADDLDAKDRLIARGYERVPCEKCHGLGYSLDFSGRECLACQGVGFHWQAPMMK